MQSTHLFIYKEREGGRESEREREENEAKLGELPD